jgi:hypothetical protein
LTPREREAWSLTYYESLSRREAAKRMGISAAAVQHLLHSARARLGMPTTTKAKQTGYKPVADRRREREAKINRWFLDRVDLLSEVEFEIVNEATWDALAGFSIDPDAPDAVLKAQMFLRENGSAQWCRQHLTREAFSFLERTMAPLSFDHDPGELDDGGPTMEEIQHDMGLIGEGDPTVMFVLDR